MGGTKTKETKSYRNTYQYMDTPETGDISALRALIPRLAQADPSITYEAGRMKQNVENRFNNPFGANYSPEVQDAIRYSQGQEIDQRAGMLYRQSARQGLGQQVSAMGSLAQLTSPKLVQTGGSSTGTVTQGGGMGSLFASLAGGAVA